MIRKDILRKLNMKQAPNVNWTAEAPKHLYKDQKRELEARSRYHEGLRETAEAGIMNDAPALLEDEADLVQNRQIIIPAVDRKLYYYYLYNCSKK